MAKVFLVPRVERSSSPQVKLIIFHMKDLWPFCTKAWSKFCRHYEVRGWIFLKISPRFWCQARYLYGLYGYHAGKMNAHHVDVHQPGHFPCPGQQCGKVQKSWNIFYKNSYLWNAILTSSVVTRCANVPARNVARCQNVKTVFFSTNQIWETQPRF